MVCSKLIEKCAEEFLSSFEKYETIEPYEDFPPSNFDWTFRSALCGLEEHFEKREV